MVESVRVFRVGCPYHSGAKPPSGDLFLWIWISQPRDGPERTDERADDAHEERGRHARGEPHGGGRAVEGHVRVRGLRRRGAVGRVDLAAGQVRAVGADRARRVRERARRGRADALALDRVPERRRAVGRD